MLEDLLIRVFAFLVTIAVLVIVHELGHYLVARWCGVRVLRFSFGFGKVLWSRRYGKDQTEWAISAIPLGGYVKMLGEGKDQVIAPRDAQRAFHLQPVRKRFAIVAAGPLTNLLLAVLLFAGVGMAGIEEIQPSLATPKPGSPAEAAGLQAKDRILAVDGVAVTSVRDLNFELMKIGKGGEVTLTVSRAGASLRRTLSLASVTSEDEETGNILPRLGLQLYLGPPLVDGVVRDSPAALAGIHAGDRILAVNDVALESPMGLSEAVNSANGQPVALWIARQSERFDVTLTPQLMRDEATGKQRLLIGVKLAIDPAERARLVSTVRYGPVSALVRGATQTWDITWLSLKMMGRMIIGDASLKNLSGPITIADYAGQSAVGGLERFIMFLALVSVALGVMNLLPIPLLDGGHLLYYSVEILRGRPLSEKAMAFGQRIGMAVLFILIAIALLNDFTRLL